MIFLLPNLDFKSIESLGVIIATLVAGILLARYNVFEKVSKGWKDYGESKEKVSSDLGAKLKELETEIAELKAEIINLTRELDARSQINSQDRASIKALTEENLNLEEKNLSLIRQMKDILKNE